MSILIISAHPDDEVLGCGGFIAKYAKVEDIYCVHLTNGEGSRDFKSKKGLASAISSRKNSAKKASKILGIKQTHFCDFPDNQLDQVSILTIAKHIEKFIDLYKPHTLLTHSHNDLNIDHKIACETSIIASRPSKEQTIKKILSFDIPSSREFAFHDNIKIRHNWYEDITKKYDLKLKALKAYNQELKKNFHPRSINSIKSYDSYIGSIIGVKYSETFLLYRNVC